MKEIIPLQNTDQTRREAEEHALDEAKIAERERATNIGHRHQVQEYMAAELSQHVTSIQEAKYLVSLIADGKIANLKIIY